MYLSQTSAFPQVRFTAASDTSSARSKRDLPFALGEVEGSESRWCDSSVSFRLENCAATSSLGYIRTEQSDLVHFRALVKASTLSNNRARGANAHLPRITLPMIKAILLKIINKLKTRHSFSFLSFSRY